MDEDQTAADAKKSPKTARGGLILALAMGLLIVLAAGWWWSSRDTDPRPDNVWAETTHPFDPDCEADCPQIMEPRPIGHGGDNGLTFSMRTDPLLDDAVAQWGMCMDSVFTCVGLELPEAADERADLIRQCVAHSSCPDECKSHFAEQASGDLESVAAAFESNFIEETAWCSPSR